MDGFKKVSFMHSISSKVILLTTGVVILAIAGVLSSVLVESRGVVKNISDNYILTMAETTAEIVEKLPADSISTQLYENVLKGVKMEGIDSSYAYLVDMDGTLLYHPTAEKIGKPVENAVVSAIVADLEKGKIPENKAVTYKFNGSDKYAGYAITSQKQIVVVMADKEEVLAPLTRMIKKLLLLSTTSLLVCVVIGYIVSIRICTPIKKLTDIISKTAQLDFRQSLHGEQLQARKDETGEMARAVHFMRNNLRNMIKEIDTASKQITQDIDGLKQITDTVDRMCSDNSSTSEQLAAGMEETAATTVTINEHVSVIKTNAEDINAMASDRAKTSEEIMNRAHDLRNKTVVASNKTMDMYNNVKLKANEAIEGSKAVEKINELTDSIMEISSQTGLLALNASIEAARAGEAGRGFSVVATEIGRLSDQTSTTIQDIGTIVDAVNTAVTNMAECLEETTEFLEHTVLTEYKEFEQVSDQYQQDATVFKNSMNDVSSAMGALSESIETIANALNGINATIGESSIGVTNIAEKTSNMVEKTQTTNSLVSESYICVENLKKAVQQFILE